MKTPEKDKKMFAKFAAAVIALAMMAIPATAQTIDYLGVPGPIDLGGKSYVLSWSSRPSENYVKQEYVPAGQAIETYDQMVLIERVTGPIKVIDAVKSQIAMLQKRKSSDALVNFSILEKDATQEVVLDFLISGKDAHGDLIVEWNLYRYAPKQSGVLLFALSRRAYGNDNAKAFLGNLKQLRHADTSVILKADLPKTMK